MHIQTGEEPALADMGPHISVKIDQMTCNVSKEFRRGWQSSSSGLQPRFSSDAINEMELNRDYSMRRGTKKGSLHPNHFLSLIPERSRVSEGPLPMSQGTSGKTMLDQSPTSVTNGLKINTSEMKHSLR